MTRTRVQLHAEGCGAALFSACVGLMFSAAGCTARFDAEQGRAYPCERGGAASECPSDGGNWTCGLEGFCVNLDVGGSYQCESNADCALVEGADWHCGYPNGFDDVMRCYDRATAAAIACRYDAGVTDCAPGWACGPDTRCRDLDAGVELPCASDEECGGGYRCSLDNVCKDASAQALRPTVDLEKLTRTRLSPAPLGNPELFGLWTDDYLGPSRIHYAAATDGGIEYLSNDFFGVERPDGGWVWGSRFSLPATAPSSIDVLDIYYDGRAVWTIDEGHLWRYDANEEEGISRLDAGTALTGATMRAESEWQRMNFLMFAHSEYAVYRYEDGGSSSTPRSMPKTGTEENVIHDMVEVDTDELIESCWSCGNSALATTREGVFLAVREYDWVGPAGGTRAAPYFVPIVLPGVPNRACTAGGTPPALAGIRTGYFNSGQVTLAVELPAEGSTKVLVGRTEAGVDVKQTCGTLGLTDSAICDACPSGWTMEHFSATYEWDEQNERRPSVYARCMITQDGVTRQGTFYSLTTAAGTCSAPVEFLNGGADGFILRASTAAPNESNFMDSFDRPWACTYSGYTCFTTVLEHRIDNWVGPIGQAGLFAAEKLQPEDPQLPPFTSGWKLEPGVGVVPIDRWGYWFKENALLASIVGAPEWFLAFEPEFTFDEAHEALTTDIVVRRVSDFDLPTARAGQTRPLVRLLSTQDLSSDLDLRSRFFAERVATPNGGAALVVAGGDRIWVADVTEHLADADGGSSAPTLNAAVRVVPLPFAQVEAIAMLPHDATDPSPRYLRGYVLIQGRVFRIDARSQTNVAADEIAIGDDLEALSIWADGTRGRVGMSNGDVYSLPEPVLIGKGPLADGDDRATAFAEVCGDAFALGSKGLYRLTPGSGTVGQWERIDFGDQLPAAGEMGWTGAQFHRTHDGLLIIGATGAVLRVAYSDCTR